MVFVLCENADDLNAYHDCRIAIHYGSVVSG